MEHVTSADGTPIAYERTGSGPPLVLVHGSLNDHAVWARVLGAFAERHTVYAMDRRGRGESGKPGEHALERQFEDVVAVVQAAGEPVALIGHSYGARCALGAAALVPELVKRLVLYEPPSADNATREGVGEAFERDDPSTAVEGFMRMIGVPPDQLEALKKTPFWTYLGGFAPTMPSEARARRPCVRAVSLCVAQDAPALPRGRSKHRARPRGDAPVVATYAPRGVGDVRRPGARCHAHRAEVVLGHRAGLPRAIACHALPTTRGRFHMRRPN